MEAEQHKLSRIDNVYIDSEEIRIYFKDENKTDINITTFSSSSDLYSFLYAYPLSLGDVIEFEIIRNNNSMTVAVPVIQYRYYI